MKIYLVGGAVRDHLMNRPSQDRDWVVVDGSAQAMLERGYVPVGADFPVFLDPNTGEEYALARQERKAGNGYHGFETTTRGVTLEEDLSRRDLTINAMAMAEDGALHDPFGGQADVANKVLRHVGPAFSEDPVRILRVLRLLARFGPEWTVAPETWELLQSMVNSGVADHLVPERIWKEVSRGLREPSPWLMLASMQKLGLHKLPCFAPYARSYMGSPKWLKEAVARNASLPVRFALTFGQVGAHAPRAIPKQCWQLSRVLFELEGSWPRAPGNWLKLMADVGFHRESSLWDELLSAWEAMGHADGQLVPLARAIGERVGRLDTQAISRSMPPGPAVGQAIESARLAAISEAMGPVSFR